MTTPTATKRERLEARITAEQKALFEQAAALTGRSLTDFVVSSAQTAAEQAIQAHRVWKLTERDTELLVNALLNPPEPNERLRRAARRHHELVRE